MYHFHTRIHARPDSAIPGPPTEVQGRSVPTLSLPPASLGGPLPVTFEQAAETLEGFRGMYVEPDGYFIWRSAPGEAAAWQIDGHLYDRHGRLIYVDLKGSTPQDQFDRLLRGIGWPGSPLMFELVQQAVFLGEEEFRRHAVKPIG